MSHIASIECPTYLMLICRVRGYQFRSEGKGEPRKNPVAYRSLEDGRESLTDAELPSPTADGEGLEQHGFATRLK